MTKFMELLSHIESNHVIIRMHNYPDPDAIASAYALQSLLKIIGNKGSTICYQGEIDKYSTNKMIATLNIDIININDMQGLNKTNEIILVDTQKGNANIDNFLGEKVICIDHHPIFEPANYLYCDIRPRVGACSSIMAEYLFENNIIPNINVATALLYGIKIDTANLTRGVSDLDLDMFYLLYKKSDLSIINSLVSSTLLFGDLITYTNALKNVEVKGRISFVDSGDDCPESLIAMLSDFMLSIDEVKFSVVYSIKTDGIKISVRSENNSYNSGKIIHKALRNMGSGGGHQIMAGGFVSFEDNELPLDTLIKYIKENFINAINHADVTQMVE